MPQYSISTAHRITGKSRTTLAKHIARGKLSCREDEQGNKLIDASELMRVYGAACDFSKAEEASLAASPSETEQGVQNGLSSLKVLLDKETAERERERGQLQRQIEHLQDALKLAQESHNKALLLLEDKTAGGGEWERAIKRLEERIANQEEGAKQLLAEAIQTASKTAKTELLSQSWWKLIFVR